MVFVELEQFGEMDVKFKHILQWMETGAHPCNIPVLVIPRITSSIPSILHITKNQVLSVVADLGGRGLSTETELPEINCRYVTRSQDDWDVEEFVSKTCMGTFLHHPAFRLLLASFIILNAIIIAVRTEPTLEEKYFGFFSAIDMIVMSLLVCEVLLNWYYGFSLYWKDGWNIINFFIMLLLFLGLIFTALNDRTIVHMLRVMRLMHVCTMVTGLARMIQVILQSIPDMANIMILLFAIMLVFSVFGVTLFGSMVPNHFGNMGTALYSLFICITQDGWINIYDDFADEGLALEIGGALYFFIFITFGAFIFANLLVAVVTTNLERSVSEYKEKRQSEAHLPLTMNEVGMDEGSDDDLEPSHHEPLHVREVMRATPMVHHQNLLSLGNLGNLNEATCEELCVVLEAIHENLKAYRVIRDEIDQIVDEVRSIKFNVDQEQEVVLRNIRGSTISETMLNVDPKQPKGGDVLSTMFSLEKMSPDVEFQKGGVKSAAMRVRRQSATLPPSSEDSTRKPPPSSEDSSSKPQDSLAALAAARNLAAAQPGAPRSRGGQHCKSAAAP
ncbi:cation channel sperm-associated protein 4 [Lacerta agilis]|uniref:cation channel sperm-associated protein 4 n=1 Tax=Lacerta agilis TaxID=80427 RepID=UPI00141928C5|nr:cation channel sperm-associated protein 4 [Lacerta agilis]